MPVAGPPRAGERFPDLRLADHNGNERALSELVAGDRGAVSEAVEALQALGYKPADAEKMISRAQQQGDTQSTAAQLIKAALQASVRQ